VGIMSGYYVTIEFELDIQDVKGLAEAIKPLQDRGEYWGDIEISCREDPHGNKFYLLELDEYYVSYDDDEFEELYDIIAPFVKGNIYLRGEESEQWVECFDGKGTHTYKDSSVFYGFDSYEQFMKECKEQLPKEIVEQLEQWNIARRI